MSLTPVFAPSDNDPLGLGLSTLPRLRQPGLTVPQNGIPVSMPDPNDPRYRPLHGLAALGPVLSQFAGIPTKNGLEPLESVRQLGQTALEAPQARYKQDLTTAETAQRMQQQQAQTDLERQRAESEAVGQGSRSDLEAAQAEEIRRNMGQPKAVAGDEVTFTGPNNEKVKVVASTVGGQRVYSVAGGGAPTANSATTAEDALREYLGKQAPQKTAAPVQRIQPSGGLTTPRLSVPQTSLPMAGSAAPAGAPAAAADPLEGWVAGEPATGERPASKEEMQSMREVIGASNLASAAKAGLLTELRPGMTTAELDRLNARFETAAGRISAADIADKDRRSAAATVQADKKTIRDQDPVFAFDPKTKQRVYTTRGEAETAGYTGLGKAVTEADVSKEEAATRQFNDVQMNVSKYKISLDSIQGDIPKDQVERMTQIIAVLPQLEKTGGDGIIQQLSIGTLPTFTSQMQQGEMAKAWNYLTPENQALMTGYFRARGSLLAYQRALTGTGRTTQQGLALELPNLPEPYVGATVADKRLKSFQENIDVASKGLVKFPWLDTPEDIKTGIEHPRPDNVPGDYTYKENGPKGAGWYRP